MSKRNGKHGGDAPDTDLVLERLRRHLEFLGLTHTRDELDDLLAWAVRERPGTTALLEHVLGAEAAHKLQERITRRVDRSGLKEHKTLEAFDFDFQPNLDKSIVVELARLDFVRRHDDVVITGNPGTGKSHLLKASVCATPAASTCSTTFMPGSPTARILDDSGRGRLPSSWSLTT